MNTNNWSIHIEFVVIFITLIGGFYTLDGKVDRVRHECTSLYMKESQRTDRLYEMFYDLIKETRK